jgi:hypothetical protein
MESGISFDHLAKRYSKCPSGRNAAAIWVSSRADGRPFDQAVFSCPLLKPTARCKPNSATTSLRCCIAAKAGGAAPYPAYILRL